MPVRRGEVKTRGIPVATKMAQIKCSGTSLRHKGCVKAGFTVPPCTYGRLVRRDAASLSYMSQCRSLNQAKQYV